MFRAKYDRTNRINSVLARAIFTPNLSESHDLLRDTIWSPHIDARTFHAIMSRADTSLDYVRNAMERPPAGWSRERMLGLLLDPKAPSLKSAINNQKSNVAPDPPSEEALKLPWEPLHPLDSASAPLGEWFWTIYYRVLGAHYLLHAYRRCNVHADRFFEHKLRRFMEAHLSCCMLLDSDPNVAPAELIRAYGGGLGETHYPCDVDLIRLGHREHTLKRTPWSHIGAAVQEEMAAEGAGAGGTQTPYLLDGSGSGSGSGGGDDDMEWAPFPNAQPETHTIYYKLVAQLNACMRLMMSQAHAPGLGDQLWLYYASWTELFHYCIAAGRMDDEFLTLPIGSKREGRFGVMQLNDTASPWTLWGGWAHEGTRVFAADDLPDLYGMLSSIPLRGEQHAPRYVLGKIYQKALPFACGRRHIIKLIGMAAMEEPGLWTLFQRLSWTMLANLYPGELAAPHGRLGMRDLLRIKELTDDREALMDALAVRNPSASGASLIVFTIFRMHILHMASFQPQYVEQASQCVDWPFFRADSIKLANLVRHYHLFGVDCMATARLHLGKTVKTPNARVHRMRRRSLSVTLMDQINEKLEKTLLKTMRTLQREQRLLASLSVDQFMGSRSLFARFIQRQLASPDDDEGEQGQGQGRLINVAKYLEESRETVDLICKRFQDALTVTCKSAILNALIALPPEQRMTGPAFAMLTAPGMGGISDQCVALLCDLVRTYELKAAPKEFRQRIGQLDFDHFMVVCFYLNAAALVDRISFVALDADTVQRTDAAMTRRLVPGTQFDADSAYSVYVALCCERICTLQGRGKYGNRKVAYDVERQCYVCAAGKKHIDEALSKRMDGGGGGGDEEQEDQGKGGKKGKKGKGGKKAKRSLLEQLDDDDDNEGYGDGDDDDDDEDNEDLLGQMQGAMDEHAAEMQERKAIRNMRKRASRVPCGQPVLRINLRGRALVWGNTADSKRQYMRCPECASLHLYSVLGFSDSESGLYRCPECARKELMHLPYRTCAYCGPARAVVADTDCVSVFCPGVLDAQDLWQRLYFCKVHLRIVQRHATLPKPQLWERIRQLQEQRALLHAGGNHKSQTDRNLMLKRKK